MIKRILFALSLLVCTPALAQWQVPNNAVPVGRGSGAQGFKSVGPCAEGQVIVWSPEGVPVCGAGGGGGGSLVVGTTPVTGGADGDVLTRNGSVLGSGAIMTIINTVCSLSPSTCKAVLGYASVAWYGAVGYAPVANDCTTNAAGAPDDTTALSNALNAGFVVDLTPGRCFKITAAITGTTNYSGLRGDGSPTIFMPNASFNYASPGAASFGPTASGIYVQGQVVTPFVPSNSITLENFRLQYEATTALRWVNGVMARNNCNLKIVGLEIFGLPSGDAIQANSSCNSVISGNYIHDMTDNNNWGVGSGAPAPRAIRIDSDLFNTASNKVMISKNVIRDITVGATYIASSGGYQADAIRIQRENATEISVLDNEIANTGQGIDSYAQQSRISGNTIRGTYVFGIALKYNGSSTQVTANTILSSGMAGIALAPGISAAPFAGTMENIAVNGNTIFGIDNAGVWAGSDTACLLIFPDASALYKAVNNTFQNNTCIPGPAKYAVTSKATGPNNFVDNALLPGVSGYYFPGPDTGNTRGIGAGSYLTATRAQGSPITLTTGTVSNVTSVALGAGDWDVSGQVISVTAGGPSTVQSTWVTASSATFPALPDGSLTRTTSTTTAGGTESINTGVKRITGPATAFLCVQNNFSGTATAYGMIRARQAQ